MKTITEKDLDSLFSIFEMAADEYKRNWKEDVFTGRVNEKLKEDLRRVGHILELDSEYFLELAGFPLYEQSEFDFDF